MAPLPLRPPLTERNTRGPLSPLPKRKQQQTQRTPAKRQKRQQALRFTKQCQRRVQRGRRLQPRLCHRYQQRQQRSTGYLRPHFAWRRQGHDVLLQW